MYYTFIREKINEIFILTFIDFQSGLDNRGNEFFVLKI